MTSADPISREAAHPSAVDCRIDRVLGWVGAEDVGLAEGKAEALRRFLLMHLAVQGWYRLAVGRELMDGAFALLLTVALGLGWGRRGARLGVYLALIGVVLQGVHHFPFTANHLYLEGLLLALFVLCDGGGEEARLLLQGCRWLVVLVLFHSGLQKLLWGYYFDGSFFAQMISIEERFAAFFRFVLPEAEWARLRDLPWPAPPGTGPYRVASPWLAGLANATYLLEMGFALLLLARRARPYALAGAAALVVAIELAAREVFFGALCLNLLLLFGPGALNRRLLGAFVALYAVLALMALGVLPRWVH